MVKIRFVLLAVLFSLVMIFTGTNTINAQNIVTTIDIDPIPEVLALPSKIGLPIPFEIEVNHINNRLYIARFNIYSKKSEMVVIDSLSNDVIDTISFSKQCFHSQIEINPTSRRIYLATLQCHDNKIHVIDGITNKIISTIKIEDGIAGIAVNSVTNRIYAVNLNMVTVTVIDGETNEIIDVIKLQEDTDLSFRSGGIMVNPFTNRIYVLKDSTRKKTKWDVLGIRIPVSVAKEIKEKEIIVIDGKTNRVIEAVKLDINALSDVIDPHNTNSIFSNDSSSNVKTIITSVYKMAINPLTNHIYIRVHIKVRNFDDINAILVIDGLTNNIINSIDMDEIQDCGDLIAVNHKTNRIYLTDTENNMLKVIDGGSHRLVSEINIGCRPYSIKVDQPTNLVYITNLDYGQIKIINEKGMDFAPQTLIVYPESAVHDSLFQDATVTLLEQNGKPLQGVEVKASANDRFATVLPPSMVTDDEGNAVFRFKFSTDVEEENDKRITFTANQQETFITNEE